MSPLTQPGGLDRHATGDSGALTIPVLRDLLERGATPSVIVQMFGCHERTVHKKMKKHGLQRICPKCARACETCPPLDAERNDCTKCRRDQRKVAYDIERIERESGKKATANAMRDRLDTALRAGSSPKQIAAALGETQARIARRIRYYSLRRLCPRCHRECALQYKRRDYCTACANEDRARFREALIAKRDAAPGWVSITERRAAPPTPESVHLDTLLADRVDGEFYARSWWWRKHDVALALLCRNGLDLNVCTQILNRSAVGIADRAYRTGLALPKHWRPALSNKVRGGPVHSPLLAYPYISEVRGQHATLLKVNSMVPQGLPCQIRGDVCQEIMMAVWEGKITLEELSSAPKLIRQFIAAARRANCEGAGYALSLDQPMYDGRQWYDVLAAPETEEQQDEDFA